MFWQLSSRPARRRRAPSPPVERLDVSDLHFAEHMATGLEVDLPGRGTAFVRIADGPPGARTVLLVHGMLATADLNWSLAIPTLSSRFRVVAPDLRGHGRGTPTRRFAADECADDLAAIVNALDLGPVIVVGYSLGGMVAQVFMHRHPELVVGLVLCATACSFQVPTEQPAVRFVAGAARRMPEGLRRAAMLALLRPRSANSPRGRWLMAQVRAHDTRALLEAIAEVANFNSEAWIGATACPAAVILTMEDRVVSPASQRLMSDSLAESTVYELAADHFACVKLPDEFNATLLTACVGLGS